jgi:hypothetical protein
MRRVLSSFACKPMKEYSWWGFGENEPPEHLKTKKQLSGLGKKPGEPVGVIRTPDYDCYLYDPETCPDKRPLTEKQKAYLERRRQEKERTELEKKKRIAYGRLLFRLSYIFWDMEAICAFESEAVSALRIETEGKENYVKRRCQSLIEYCKEAKDEFRFLYPDTSPQPDPGSAVLGEKSAAGVPLDPDGQCRAVVLGGCDA